MTRCRNHVLILMFIVLTLVSAPRAAFAACTSPDGEESRTIYDWTNHVMKLCDGTNWLSMGSGSSSGSAGYIQFSNGSGGFASDAGFFWDNTSKGLGIGTTTPLSTAKLDLYDATTGQNTVMRIRSGAANDGTGGNAVLRIVSDNSANSNIDFGDSGNSAIGRIQYVNADDSMRFTTNSNERMRITSAGNVGIGTSTPSDVLEISRNATGGGGIRLTNASTASLNDLDFYESSTLAAFVQYRGSTFPTNPNVLRLSTATSGGQLVFGTGGGSERMRIDGSGNVGIGTTTPSGTLYVKGNTVLSDDTANITASYPLRIYSASSAAGLLNLYYQNADVNGAALSLQKYKSSGNEIAAGDILGSIDFFGTTGAGNSLRAAQIRATAETGWGGTGDAPGRLTFWTTPDGSSTAAERVRIDNAGNVGIGTTTPAQRLAVNTTNTVATSGSVTTARMDLTASPAANSSASYYALFNRADLSGSSDVTGTISSNHSYSTHSGSGTLYAGYGATSALDNLGAGTVSNGYGAYNYARANSAGTITGGYGSYSAALTNNSSTTMTTGIGAYNTAYTTLGTMTNAYGSYNVAQNSAPTTMALAMGSREYVIVGSGSTVTSAYGVGIYLSNAGTVANWYGLYIPAISGTAPTTSRYPIYVADTGSNYFAGNVGIGTTTPATPLEVNGNITATAYLYSSDRRLKTDIEPLTGQLGKIMALEPVSYTLKADAKRAPHLGLIAQDAEIVYPEVVHGKGDAMKSIDYAALVGPLIAAVKELKAANDDQSAAIEAQATEIKSLKTQLESLRTVSPNP